jgi:hypothetical protein
MTVEVKAHVDFHCFMFLLVQVVGCSVDSHFTHLVSRAAASVVAVVAAAAAAAAAAAIVGAVNSCRRNVSAAPSATAHSAFQYQLLHFTF